MRIAQCTLIATIDLAMSNDALRIRIDTFRQAKGESLDAVLYLTNREHVNVLLAVLVIFTVI